MSEEKKKKESKKGQIFSSIIFILGGAASGIIIGKFVANTNFELTLTEVIFYLFLLMLFIFLTMIFHIIIHEMGHLIFGLISGYKFVSFRVGSLMLKKEKGKYVLKKFNIVGTAGQCLMRPDDNWNAYDYPYTLYNLGGVIVNIIASLIPLVLLFTFSNSFLFRAICFISFIVGIIFALNNAIPMKIGVVANDGYNILALSKDKNARRAFYLQLYINALQTDGVRIKDMSKEYFEFSEDADLSNTLIASIGAYKSDYLHDKMEFTKAKDNSLYLIENAPGLLGIHKNELACELLFYEMIGLCRQDEIDRLYTDELKKYIKSTMFYINRRRLTYTYEIFVNHDIKAAKRELEQFEKVAKTYPFPGIIESERELIKFIDNLAIVKNVEMT